MPDYANELAAVLQRIPASQRDQKIEEAKRRVMPDPPDLLSCTLEQLFVYQTDVLLARRFHEAEGRSLLDYLNDCQRRYLETINSLREGVDFTRGPGKIPFIIRPAHNLSLAEMMARVKVGDKAGACRLNEADLQGSSGFPPASKNALVIDVDYDKSWWGGSLRPAECCSQLGQRRREVGSIRWGVWLALYFPDLAGHCMEFLADRLGNDHWPMLVQEAGRAMLVETYRQYPISLHAVPSAGKIIELPVV